MYGRELLMEVVALSKLWYLAQILPLPQEYSKEIQRRAFLFIWSCKLNEPIARKFMFLKETEGGMNITDIRAKCSALYFKNTRRAIVTKDTLNLYFVIYWMGITLREEENDWAKNRYKHSFDLPEKYIRIKTIYRKLKMNRKEIDWKKMSTEKTYSLLSNSHVKNFKIDWDMCFGKT